MWLSDCHLLQTQAITMPFYVETHKTKVLKHSNILLTSSRRQPASLIVILCTHLGYFISILYVYRNIILHVYSAGISIARDSIRGKELH